MNEPLSLKSDQSLNQAKRGAILSASEMLMQFNLRSPSNARVCLTDRVPQSCKSISSLKIKDNIPFNFKRTKSKRQKVQEPLPNISRILTNKTRHEDIPQFPTIEQQMHREKSQIRIKQDADIIPIITKKNFKLTLPLHKILQNKENIKSQTERTSKLLSNKRSHALKTNINLINRESMTVSIRHQNKEYFRKSSDASTLSLRTKHANSIQHFDEEEGDQLFKTSNSSISALRGQPNLISLLEETKRKLYQQIYSLDKKLIKEQQLSIEGGEQQIRMPEKNEKKTILISVKKKAIAHHNKSCKDLLAL